jgi:hypothetical protein
MKSLSITRLPVSATVAKKKRYSQRRNASESAPLNNQVLQGKAEPILIAEGTTEDHKKEEKSIWNGMSHLYLKRFRDDDPMLTEGAKRNRAKFPYVAIAEMDPSGRALCKLCGERIHPKGSTLRMGLMLECHKGYRNLCTLHASPCFWQHPETKKLASLDEIYIHPNVATKHKEMIAKQFANMIKS